MAVRRADLEEQNGEAVILRFPDRAGGARRRRFARRRLAVGLAVLTTLMLTARLAGAVVDDGWGLAPPVSVRGELAGGRVAVVRPGETLWDLAHRYAPGDDPRAVVDELAAVNRLDGPLQAGTRIRIPD